MPKYIIKLDVLSKGERYMMWCDVVDAPTTPLLTWRMAMTHFPAGNLRERLARAKKTGTSALHATVETLVRGNSAGPGMTCITVAEIIKQYSLPLAVEDGRVSL